MTPASVMNFHQHQEIFSICKRRECHQRSSNSDTWNRPANGEFTVEHAVNRAFTTLSYNGKNTGLYMDGKDHPGLGTTRDGKQDGSDCISEPNSKCLNEAFQRPLFTQRNEVHTQNETMASGTIFAISYVSDLKKVTKENLVVFTVLPKYSPFHHFLSFFILHDMCVAHHGGGSRHIKFLIYQNVRPEVAFVQCVLDTFSCTTTILSDLCCLVGLGMCLYALRKVLVLITSRCRMDAVYQICTCWAFVVESLA